MTPERDFHFASDNTAGACPEALAAIVGANAGRAPSYGDDGFTARAKGLLRDLFETDCETFFVFNGTAANALALAAACRPHQSVFCHESAHLDTDECGAPEFFTGGSKLIPLRGAHGKLEPAGLEPALHRGHGIHYPKPGAVSITQSSELGTVYTPSETRALADFAHSNGMALHVDGARFANAAAAQAGAGRSPADLTWRAGVDVLSLGGTKNGMIGAEAVVFFRKDLAADFAYRVKQSGQLSSKMRYAGAQWAAMLESGAWLRNAAHANRMAGILAEGLRRAGAELLETPEANGVFLKLSPRAAAALEASGWQFYLFIGDDGYRLMCAWDTTEPKVEALVRDAARALRA